MDSCPICYNEITLEFTYLNCNCKYRYHSKCINKWLKKNNSCPTCRKTWGKKPKKQINEDLVFEIGRRLFLESIGLNSSRIGYYLSPNDN